ncbi:HEAT repeat domain-containing protein [Paenibacillus soyae]|uniref:HEAT repeat domain-containing protein n=1 Tax=Paenibacillus soyae TaxID=2969249 RepID=A0A9X2MLD6_9BACL|nr:HEAT repeat domain-containing protein [Paenibacillus soyae]MCR2802734.1 HEAT repeat domain-containing protein [Paenibacillus soyae]
MSIDILYELRGEVRRIFIAGCGLAAGDIRLGSLLPRLEKLGESSPVFQRIGQSVQKLLQAEPAQAANALMELGALLQSVLYTQGKTDTKEELMPLAGTSFMPHTSVPYRKLQPVLAALTQKGQGRLEQLQQADGQGLFADFRVLPAAVGALSDSYSEIPELLQRKVLPKYGMQALHELRKQLDLQGGKGDARRLELIHDLLEESAQDLLVQAATEGSTDVRSTAIMLLGRYESQEEFLLEQADDKKKDIRAAAYTALSALATDKALDRLKQALFGKDRDIAVIPVRECRSDELAKTVIDEADQLLRRLSACAANEAEKLSAQLQAYLHSLTGKRHPGVLELLKSLFSSQQAVRHMTEPVQETAADLLLDLRLPEADAFAVTLDEPYKRRFIGTSFQAAARVMSASELYERYAPMLQDGRQAGAKELRRTLNVLSPDDLTELLGGREPGAEWDPRWARLFAKLDEQELVCLTASGPDSEIEAYLIGKCRNKARFSHYNTVQSLIALFRIGSKEAPELLMSLLEDGGQRHLYYLDETRAALLTLLPKSYEPRLRAFAETLTYESVKEQVQRAADVVAGKDEAAEQAEEKGTGIREWIKSKMR